MIRFWRWLVLLALVATVLSFEPRASAQTISVLRSANAGVSVTSNTFSFTTLDPTPTSQSYTFTNNSGLTLYNMMISVAQKNPDSYMLLKYQCLNTFGVSGAAYPTCLKTLDGKVVSFFLADGTAILPGESFLIQLGGSSNKWDPASLFNAVANIADPRLDPAVRLGDYDGNGKADLTWHNSSTGEGVIWMMNLGLKVQNTRLRTLPVPTILSALWLTTMAVADWEIVASADFNGDFRTDILWQNVTTGDVVAWINNGISFDSYPLPEFASRNIVGAADMDADGKADIVSMNSETGAYTVSLMDGISVKSESALSIVPTDSWELVALTDANGDRKADMMWRDLSTGEVFVWLMDGATCTYSGSLGTEPALYWQVGAVADFNGDGKAEVLWRAPLGGNYLWTLAITDTQAAVEPRAMSKTNGQRVIGIGRGIQASSEASISVISGEYSQAIPDLNWQIAAVGDMNGDGKADLVWRNRTTGANIVWFMNGATVVSSQAIETVGDLNWQLF